MPPRGGYENNAGAIWAHLHTDDPRVTHVTQLYHAAQLGQTRVVKLRGMRIGSAGQQKHKNELQH